MSGSDSPDNKPGTLTTSYGGAAQGDAARDRTADVPGPKPGDRIGRYVVEEQLGQGGMGVVVAAHDPELTRQVALKVVRPDVGDRAYRARLVREARAMARLDHPHVVRVYDAGEVRGEVFVAMELVRGETLTQWLKAQPRSWRDVIRHFVAAGRGLAAAHAAGMVHRDFKPDNVMVRAIDGRVCVTDFGLAIPTTGAGGDPAEPPPEAPPPIGEIALTRTGAVVGTPAYMAPEQRRGEEVDARADVFSFCVSLYEGLYGVRPFPGGTGDPTAPGTSPPGGVAPPGKSRGVPRAVRRAVLRGLAHDPAARWPSIDPLLAALERAIRQRRAALIATGAVISVGAIAAVVVALRPGDPAPPFAVKFAKRLTFAPGCEGQPAFLPDNSVVYAQHAGIASTLHIWREAGDEVLGPGEYPAVSPSGRYLAALDHGTLVLRDLQQPGTPKSLGASTSIPAWLDERELLAGVNGDVVARPIAGGADRVLGHVPPGMLPRATAGGGGRLFAIHRPDAALAEDFVDEIMPDGTPRQIREGVYWRAGLHYRAADNRVYFVQQMNTTLFHLFKQVPDGVVEPVSMTGDVSPTGGFDITPDGHHLVYSNCAEQATLVRIKRDGATSELLPHGAWRDGAPAMIDASRFAYTSNRSGQFVVWLRDGRSPDRVLLPGVESGYPTVSPDHKLLAYLQFPDYGTPNTSTLWVLPLDRTALPFGSAASPGKAGLVDPTALPLGSAASPGKAGLVDPGGTPHVVFKDTGFQERAPRFTADGTALLFLRETKAGMRLYRVPVTGGPQTEVVPDEIRAFDASPIDDTFIAVSPGSQDRVRIGTLTSRELRDVPGADALGRKVTSLRYRPDGKAIAAVNSDGMINELDLADHQIRPLWKLADSPYSSTLAIDYDVDGSAIIAALISSDGDLWLADGQF